MTWPSMLLMAGGAAGCLDWGASSRSELDSGVSYEEDVGASHDGGGGEGPGEVDPCEGACDPQGRCEVMGGAPACICPTGYRSEGTMCIEDADCAALACDENARCLPGDLPASEPFCECAEGFAGDGHACHPLLSGLASSAGALWPALSPTVTSYELPILLTTDRLTLTPSAPAGATILINDQVVVSGEPWLSPRLDFGTTSVTISVRQPGHPNRDYLVNITRGAQTYLKGSLSAKDQQLGSSVAIDGDTLVVGATGRGAGLSGSAYVFVREGRGWREQAHLEADSPAAEDEFGASVAISGDSIAIGAPGAASEAGRVFVYTRKDGIWSQQAVLKGSNSEAAIGPGSEGADGFGTSVALVGDRLAVGAPGEDSAAHGVFSVVPDSDANDALEAGAAYLFSRSGIAWKETLYIKGSKGERGGAFGTSVALADATLVVGAPSEEAVAGSGSINGRVYVFEEASGLWSEEMSWAREDARLFGQSVDIDGSSIAVGAPFSGTAFVYTRASGEPWPSSPAGVGPKVAGGLDLFGISVALAGDTLVVGASGEGGVGSGFNADANDTTLGFASGAIYLFSRSPVIWSQAFYVKAPNSDKSDQFGFAVAVSGSTIVVGAAGEASAATVIGGDALDNTAPKAGAAYVIE